MFLNVGSQSEVATSGPCRASIKSQCDAELFIILLILLRTS
jgi:hypothetical protein